MIPIAHIFIKNSRTIRLLTAVILSSVMTAASPAVFRSYAARSSGDASGNPQNTEYDSKDTEDYGNVFNETADESEFSISCRTDESGYISKQYGNYPLIVTVENKGSSDFDGVLKIMFPSESGIDKPIAMARDILIPAGEKEKIDFDVSSSFLLNTGMNNLIYVRADILDSLGNQVMRAGFVLENKGADLSGPALYVAGFITDSEDKFDEYSSFTLTYPAEDYYERSDSDEETEMISADLGVIPAESSGSCDLSPYSIIISDCDPGPDAWKNISEWLISGGYLVIDRKTARKYIRSTGSRDSVGYGAGRVYLFDSTGEETLKDYEKICSDLIGDTVTASFSVKYAGSSDHDYYALDKDITDSAPDTGRYFVVFIIYIILISFVLYIVLRKKDKMEYMWGIIPACAVVFSIIVFAMEGSFRIKTISGEYYSKVILSDEGAYESTLVKSVNPGNDAAVYTITPDYDVSYFPYTTQYSGLLGLFSSGTRSFVTGDASSAASDMNTLMDSQYKLAIAYTDGGTDIISGKDSIFSENNVIAERHTQISDKLETDLSIWEGKLSGSIKNNTAYDINDAFVMRSEFVYYIGDIPSGQTVNVNGTQGRMLSEYDFSSSGGDGDFVRDIQSYDFGNATAALSVISDMMTSFHDTIGDDNIVGGFTGDYDPGINPGQFDKISGLTVMYEYTDITQSSSKWKNTAPIWGMPLTEEDSNNYTSSNHQFYSSEINMIYQIDKDQPVGRLTWLNPQNHDLVLSFYNNRTGKYDAVMNSSASMDNNELKDYINGSGQIIADVKYNNEIYNSIYYTPAFDISGGDRND